MADGIGFIGSGPELDMAQSSPIEWTDATWNPVAGCSVASAGCTNCYAMRMASRLEAMGVDKYVGLTRKSGGRAKWTGEVHCDHRALSVPTKWKKPRKIFVNSMSDLFHANVPDDFILDVWRVMQATPRHEYQLLTKRPERMLALLSRPTFEKLPNVWVGTSVENQDVVGRIDALRATPAAIRFISFEPLIGPIETANLNGIAWAIVGGESGPSARPIEEEWVLQLKRLCRAHETAFFFKQWGGTNKKATGRLLRGQTYDEMPSHVSG
jgi:protein gp37